MQPLLAKAIELAQSNVGVHEIGTSNEGVQVNKWLIAAGSEPGEPWCAAFAWNMVDEAAHILGVTNPLLRSAYCPDIGNWADRHNILFKSPNVGDSFLEYVGNDFHHTGLIQAVSGGYFKTVEGNTNNNGAREGTAVMVHDRPISSKYRFVRWGSLAQTQATRTLVLGSGAEAHKVADLPIKNGTSLAPLRDFCTWFGFELTGATNPTQEPPFNVNGRPLASQMSIIDGKGYCPVRDLVAIDPSLKVDFNPVTNIVNVHR